MYLYVLVVALIRMYVYGAVAREQWLGHGGGAGAFSRTRAELGLINIVLREMRVHCMFRLGAWRLKYCDLAPLFSIFLLQ